MIFLGATGKVIQGCRLLRFPNHQGIFLVDAFPVHKQDFTRFDVAICRVIQLVINHGSQDARFREVVLHFEVTLLMEFVGSHPDEGNFIHDTVGALREFFGDT